MRPIHIEAGLALIDGELAETSVTLEGEVIAAIGAVRPADALVIDASELHVLPGMVDIHGDAFERQIMPRPGVRFPFPIALADTDRQLAAAGVTTAFHGLTLSWEPGLRSVEGAKGFLDALAEARPSLAIDHRIQLRLETFAFEAEDMATECMRSEPRPALAFNDHTTSTVRKLEEGRRHQLGEWARRCGLTEEGYVDHLETVYARQQDVSAFVERMAKQAKDADVVMLSHDDRTVDDGVYYQSLGVTITEFPMTEEAIEHAVRQGASTVLGAPNVVRGGSHNGALGAAEMIEQGRCTILASDYHYPSMIAAVGFLIGKMGLPLDQAWSLVAEGPAEALGLKDRGRIQEGLRGDLVLADMKTGSLPSVIASLAGSNLAYLAGQSRIV